jgi:hypothetical protein
MAKENKQFENKDSCFPKYSKGHLIFLASTCYLCIYKSLFTNFLASSLVLTMISNILKQELIDVKISNSNKR